MVQADLPSTVEEERSTDMEYEALYPFRFRPLFQSYIWGGRRLETVLGKQLPSHGDFAESWEIVDHEDGQSVVAHGPLQGWTLSQLVEKRGRELFGKHHPQQKFPLLFKFLDCQRNLSVQVHPNDVQGASLNPPDLGKTEAWVIMDKQPGSKLYAGLKPGVDRSTFESELKAGTAEHCLHELEPEIGDCIFIPAGTVHALGEGLVVAEIQQSSNTTFRLYDWNRVDANGKSRPLHLEQGLDVSDFESGPVLVQVAQPTDDPAVQQLVACDKFVLNRLEFQGNRKIGGDQACHLVAVLKGSVTLGDLQLSKGQTALVPAVCEAEIRAEDTVTVLDICLP